jgi:hypothetical protein
MTEVGLKRIGADSSSGVLGRGGVDRVLQVAPSLEQLLSAGGRGVVWCAVLCCAVLCCAKVGMLLCCYRS